MVPSCLDDRGVGREMQKQVLRLLRFTTVAQDDTVQFGFVLSHPCCERMGHPRVVPFDEDVTCSGRGGRL